MNRGAMGAPVFCLLWIGLRRVADDGELDKAERIAASGRVPFKGKGKTGRVGLGVLFQKGGSGEAIRAFGSSVNNGTAAVEGNFALLVEQRSRIGHGEEAGG